MANINTAINLGLDHGIDQITFLKKEATQQQSLEFLNLPPTDVLQKPQLEKLLALPNMESFLDDVLKPSVRDRTILLPGKFRQALSRLRNRFRKAKDKNKKNSKTLSRANRFLDENDELLELLQMYRSTLYQG